MKKYINLTISACLLFVFGSALAQNPNSVYFVSYDEITKIIDGDTFKFKKSDKSHRLLCLDTEETFKGKDAFDKTSDISDRWLEFYYQVKIDKNSENPIKLESPFGYETVQWTTEFFKDVKKISVELDDTLRKVDVYGRELVYVFAEKDGKYINYNLECVKHGFSPYFNKYGNSSRYHSDFYEAQEFARKNRLGIWNPVSKCYPDYAERLIWWNKRAFQIDNFNSKYHGNKAYVNLLNNDAVDRLEENIGKEITVFGNASDIYTTRYPYLIRLMIMKEISVDIYIEESESWMMKELDMRKMESYFFYFSGVLEEYGNKFRMKLTNINQLYFE